MQHHSVSMYERVKAHVLGKPLASGGLEEQKLTWYWGLPIMASDAVSSVAYAIEEILLVLVPAIGLVATNFLPWVSAPIILLLVVLAFSYLQTIKHYPSGGGAYTVSQDNFGKNVSLFAAGSLVVDYMLTVAVSISSASAAIASAFPELFNYRIVVALGAIALITLLNLRGSKESSRIFGIPTYGFIVLMIALITTGIFRLATGSITPLQYAHVQQANLLQPIMGFAFVVLLFRAFSSGCSALTGIEAVSNSVPSFKKPATRNARIVLVALAAIILFIFSGSVTLATWIKVVPIEKITVIAQMGRAVFGAHNPLFYLLQVFTALILVLAANTAYTDLPNLLALLGRDSFMPHQFTNRGAKLTLSNGIIFLWVAASILVIAFAADVNRLIPLYSVGVFISFTLSQAGMVRKWVRDKERHWQTKMLINAFGAVLTGVTFVIVFLMKFSHGAWILAVAIPLLVLLMEVIHRHYTHVKGSMQITRREFLRRYRRCDTDNHFLCLVLVNGLTRPVLKLLNFANQISGNVIALHVATDEEYAERLQSAWHDYGLDRGIALQVLPCPYRNIVGTIEDYLDVAVDQLQPGGSIAVVMSRVVVEHLYDNLLHNQTTLAISMALRGYRDVATVQVPYSYVRAIENAGADKYPVSATTGTDGLDEYSRHEEQAAQLAREAAQE
ncbi:MAG: APC family permease [Coriobacteriia bacterium]|nr:APC family permease [Coriobacteriia bacterium]